MIAVQRRGLPARRSGTTLLLLLIGGPTAVLGVFAVAWWSGVLSPPAPDALPARAARIERWLDRELRDALSIAEAFLDDRTPLVAGTNIGWRLEGVGKLDDDGNYLSWRGTPPEPRTLEARTGDAAWCIERSGVHTRLLVRTAADPEGESALASFIVDSRVDELAAARWIPRHLVDGIDLDLRLGEGLEPSDTGAVVWRAPDGTPVAQALLRPVSRQHAAAHVRSAARAWAVLVAAILALSWVPWGERTRSAAAWAAIAIVLARLALAAARAPAWILSPELGTANVFGTSVAWGLLASPADLALSALAAYGLARCLATAIDSRTARTRPVALGLAGAAALLASMLVPGLLSVVARSSSAPLLGPTPFWRSIGAFVVAASIVVLLLTVADALVRVVRLVRPGRGGDRFVLAVVLAGLVLATSLWLERLDARVARERLQSEYATLVLDPLPARKLALAATLAHIRDRSVEDGSSLFARADPDRLAYDLWIDSELFYGGHRSALDVYDASGNLTSHFGFDLPLLVENERPTDPPFAPVQIRENESFRPVAALRQRLLHAAVRIGARGDAGWVVGHVLDEPTNLPFLPSSRAYLAALGAGAPFAGRSADDVEYVLYDASGTVVLSTLLQPPAMADVLVQSLERDGRIDVSAGDERWAGLALQDAENRLHALVVPAPGLLARLAAAVRLALLAFALVAAREVARGARGPSRIRGLVASLRGSFHRKLLVALLVASTAPLLGLALVVQSYIDRRGRETLVESATQYVRAAQRVLDDYLAIERDRDASTPAPLNDEIVYWLRNINGQEIHVYDNGLLEATSRRELFAAGAVPPRLDGEVHYRLGKGAPYVVVPARLGASTVPVAYAPVEHPDPQRSLVAAVPVVTEAEVIARSVERVADTILLATVLLAALLAVVAAYVARSVARPVRELVSATARIARGDYRARLSARTSDEVAELVRGFNSMAASLATQRADLERRREYTERLLEHATTGVISLDPAGSIVTLNPAARRLFDGTEVRPRVGDTLERALSGGPALEPLRRLVARPGGVDSQPVEVDLTGSGSPRRLRVVRVALADPEAGSIGTLVLLDDVTDLMRSNQLAAWAEMARAIAHEIKNPLTPIQLSTEHLERLLRDRGVLPSSDLEACIETVKKQVRALYDIAGEFSAYAKLPALDPRPVDPVAFAREVLAPYRAAAPRAIEIEERFEPGVGQAAIDARVLGRAVVNLIENALQAMPDGGRLTVAVESDPPTGGVVLSVSDTGAGITPEVRRRLFEPYFSTKSSGTGLGLAIVRRTVEAHGGRIELERGSGPGATFRIHLPRAPR
jgi:signal transduction histidine kinase/HAMP domain-containing protein